MNQLIFDKTIEKVKEYLAELMASSEGNPESVQGNSGVDSQNNLEITAETSVNEFYVGSLGDLSTEDMPLQDPPLSPPTAPSTQTSIWDGFLNLGLNCYALISWMMFGDLQNGGTFPGIYKLNSDAMKKAANDLEVTLSIMENLQDCQDTINGSDSAFWDGHAQLTLQIKNVDANGSLVITTKTMTAGSYVQFIDPNITMAPGHDDNARQRNSGAVGGLINTQGANQNQKQAALTAATNRRDSNVQTAQDMIKASEEIAKAAGPKAL